MKKVNVNLKPQLEINWDKPQWVQSKSNPDIIILTTGHHDRYSFSGTTLPCKMYPKGEYYKSWQKNSFNPLMDDIPFIISNKEDLKE